MHDAGDHGGGRVNMGAEGAEGMLLHMASPNESTWLPAGEKPSKRISAGPTQEIHRLRVSQNQGCAIMIDRDRASNARRLDRSKGSVRRSIVA